MKKLCSAIILFASLSILMTSCSKKSASADQNNVNKEETVCGANGISSADESGLSSDTVSSADVSEDTSDEIITDNRNIVNPVMVNYINDSGASLQEYESLSDINLNRPDSLYPNEVFTGWKESEVLNQVIDNTVDITAVIDIQAESIDISDQCNVIYNDAVYVSNDIPTQFCVPVSVGGETSFSALDLEIQYDGSAMDFVEFKDTDSDTVCNCVAEDNKINISFSSAENIDGQLDLCSLIFKSKDTQKKETSLKYNVSDFAAWDDSASDFYDVRYNIIDSKIVMY